MTAGFGTVGQVKPPQNQHHAARLSVKTLLSMLLPGVVLIYTRPVMAGMLMLMDTAVLVGAWDVVMDPVGLLTSDTALTELALWLVMWVALGVLSVFGVFVPNTPKMTTARWRGLVLASTLAVSPAVIGAWSVMPNLRAARAVFVTAPVAVPSVIVALPNTTKATAPARQVHERINILLLGGDSGPSRWGLRTDAMHLVSIDLAKGDVAVISVPRNLSRAPMPVGLRSQFPNGFTNIANAVYGWGASHPEQVIAAIGPTENPGASLTAAMVAELTGQRVDAWVLVDMQGFLDVIDAFGGVSMWVSKFITTPGNIAGGKHPLRDFTVGWHHMDGTDALGYARSRTSDSDYHRMTRQRCVLASLAAQTDASDLAWRWGAIATVLERSVRTNLTSELLIELKDAVGMNPDNARVLSLNPPLVPSFGWDPATVRSVVADVIEPPLVRTIAPPAVKGKPITATTLPVPKGTQSLEDEVADECRTRP